jgi:hypothetical protein
MNVKLNLIEDEKPYLVAGKSTIFDSYVFGFPYFYKKKVEGTNDVGSCPCIFLPTLGEVQELNLDDGNGKKEEYDIAFKNGEFHPIKGKLHKFVEEKDGYYIFEDNIRFNILKEDV